MKYSPAVTLLATCALGVSYAWADTIDVTGGNLTAGADTTTLPAGAVGTFGATGSQSDTYYGPTGSPVTGVVSSASVSAQFDSAGLSISTVSDGSSYFQYPSGIQVHSVLPAQGSVTFDVTTAGVFDYAATSPVESQEQIQNAAGSTLLSVGCLNPYVPDCASPSFSGSLALPVGIYKLNFSDTAYTLTGLTYNSDMQFSLQPAPVPLPGAVWLLLSGLLPLARFRRRGRTGLPVG